MSSTLRVIVMPLSWKETLREGRLQTSVEGDGKVRVSVRNERRQKERRNDEPW